MFAVEPVSLSVNEGGGQVNKFEQIRVIGGSYVVGSIHQVAN